MTAKGDHAMIKNRLIVSDPAQCRLLQDDVRMDVLQLLTEGGPKDATTVAAELDIDHDDAVDHLRVLSENQLIQVHRMQRPGKHEPSFQAIAREYELLFTAK